MQKTEARKEALQARSKEGAEELLPAEICQVIATLLQAKGRAVGLLPTMEKGVRELRVWPVAIFAFFAKRCAMRANCCQKTVLRAKFWVT